MECRFVCGAIKTSLQQSSLLGRLPQMGCTATAESAVQSLPTAAASVSEAARPSRLMGDQMGRGFTWTWSIEARAMRPSRRRALCSHGLCPEEDLCCGLASERQPFGWMEPPSEALGNCTQIGTILLYAVWTESFTGLACACPGLQCNCSTEDGSHRASRAHRHWI